MEQAVLAAAAPNVTILRLANIAGAGEPFDSAARPLPESLPLDRFGDGTGPVRSFISGRALAQVLARLSDLALQGRPLPRLLNVAAPRPTAMAEILSAMGRRWHWCAAPETAIQTVHLNIARLAALCPLPDDWASACHLVADLPKDITTP
jgi:nucleoside-diphosphate-sugar epimerase